MDVYTHLFERHDINCMHTYTANIPRAHHPTTQAIGDSRTWSLNCARRSPWSKQDKNLSWIRSPRPRRLPTSCSMRSDQNSLRPILSGARTAASSRKSTSGDTTVGSTHNPGDALRSEVKDKICLELSWRRRICLMPIYTRGIVNGGSLTPTYGG